MEHRKWLIPLLGAGLAFAPIPGLAQEEVVEEEVAEVESAAPSEEMPPQEVTDGGVEAVREAQASEPAPADRKFKNAQQVLRQLAKEKKWREGWDEEKKRTIVIESAEFNTADPATDSAFFPKRDMAAKKATLMAKVAIIQSINQEMSAMDLVNVPGSDVNQALGAEREKIDAELARQKELLATMLEKVDQAEADVLRGTTFGDRLNDLMAAAIKKLDAEYKADARDEKAQARYEQVKKEFEVAQRKYIELSEKAEAMQADVREQQESAVESIAKMPLYGSSVIMQTESWDQATGRYQVSVMLCWSYALERAARAIVTGEEFRVKPNPNGKKVQDWLDAQNPATMIGPRQYVDGQGNRWFLGVTARAYDDDLNSSARRRNKGLTEMYAQQMAAFCLWADVESYKLAQSALESRGNDQVQRDVVAESYAEKLTQSFSKKKIRGMQKLFSDEVTHPITGSTIYVAVYGINPNAAKAALEIEKINYATKVMDNRHQTVERGRDAANQAAVKASENRPEDFQKGYNQQKKAVDGEVEAREAAKKSAKGVNIINRGNSNQPAPKRQSTSGTFGGDVDVSDDF